MAAYKAFTINSAGDPKPWGAREEQAIKDIIDTLTVGTVDGGKQITGHRHYSLRHPTNGYEVLVAGAESIVLYGKGQGSSTGLYITQHDFFTHDWTDWSESCALSGFSGTPTKLMRYRRVGKLLFVQVLFSGVNNDSIIGFVLPFALTRMLLSPALSPVLGCLWANTGAGIDNSAAHTAHSYRGGGLSDWFLPSKDELAEMYAQRAVIGNFLTPGQVYWSSSQASATEAWMLWDNGTMLSKPKGHFGFVRPIRQGTQDPAYNIGDVGPGGGKIIWSQFFGYLEAAPEEVLVPGPGGGGRVTWVDDAMQSTEIAGADGTAIGAGFQNTEDIIAGDAGESLCAFVLADGGTAMKIRRGDGENWAGSGNLSLRGTFSYLMD